MISEDLASLVDEDRSGGACTAARISSGSERMPLSAHIKTDVVLHTRQREKRMGAAKEGGLGGFSEGF